MIRDEPIYHLKPERYYNTVKKPPTKTKHLIPSRQREQGESPMKVKGGQ